MGGIISENSYQSKEPNIEAVGIYLNVKSTNIPEELFECGKLEICFGEKDTHKCDMIMKLTSSSCDEKINWIFDKPWKVDLIIQMCLINTDKSWKTTTNSQRVQIQPDSRQSVKFEVRFTDNTQNKITDLFTNTTPEEIKDEVIEFVVTMSKREKDLNLLGIDELCSDESTFVKMRKQIVKEKMQKSSIGYGIEKCEDVPNIAIIGSGGGIRAVIGMSAAMTVLNEQQILKYAMYTAGLSGSAWYLLTLYAKQTFDPNALMESIRRNLDDFKGTKRVIVWNLLKNYGKGMTCLISPSVTDVFGKMIFDLLRDKNETNNEVFWSDTVKILQKYEVPFPLVAALQVIEHKTSQEHNEWIEFSPYQVFIPCWGTGINMQHFGKEFYGGFCTGKFKEKPIEFLHGMCGSAYAIGRDLMPSDDRLLMSLQCIKMCKRFLWSFFDYSCVAKVPNILFGIQTYYRNQGSRRGLGLMVSCLFFLCGKTKFWLRNIACDWKNMMLVDAGIAFNSPYPTILRPSRNIDLILSFDFSRRDDDKRNPFKALLQAEEWARKKNINFPNIKTRIEGIETKRGQNQYEEMYIFADENAPTIMHFVLVNNKYRDTEDFDIFPAYDTLRFNYTTEEFNKLHSLVCANVQNEVDAINECIKKAVENKKEERKKKK